jgi:hypothetical protein
MFTERPTRYGVLFLKGKCPLLYRGAGKSLARPTSLRILLDGENISFDATLVTYVNSTNIPPIMIINRIYIRNSKSYVAVACFLPSRAKDLSASLYEEKMCRSYLL